MRNVTRRIFPPIFLAGAQDYATPWKQGYNTAALNVNFTQYINKDDTS